MISPGAKAVDSHPFRHPVRLDRHVLLDGGVRRLRPLQRVNLLPLKQPGGVSAARTAILMPVYNEDVARVFSGVRAIRKSAGPDFDFYILSDSTNPANWVAEEMEWQKLKNELGEDGRIFYRHRAKNVGRKAGNIQDFCEKLGPALRLYGDPGRRQSDDRLNT